MTGPSRFDQRVSAVLLTLSGTGAVAAIALFMLDLGTAALIVLAVSAAVFGSVMWAMDKQLRAAIRRYREGQS